MYIFKYLCFQQLYASVLMSGKERFNGIRSLIKILNSFSLKRIACSSLSSSGVSAASPISPIPFGSFATKTGGECHLCNLCASYVVGVSNNGLKNGAPPLTFLM